jgi:hypothetical protein
MSLIRESGVIIGLQLVSTQNRFVLHCTLKILQCSDEMMLQVRRQMALWDAQAKGNRF